MKRNNQKVEYADILFSSKEEMRYYRDNIEPYIGTVFASCEYEKSYVLIPPFEYFGEHRRAITYSPDFTLTDVNGDTTCIEVKGWMEQDAELKIRMFEAAFPGIRLNVVKWYDKRWMPYKEAMKLIRQKRKAKEGILPKKGWKRR